MSLCYDFQKWTIVSLLSVTISLTIGLVLMQYAHGITEEQRQDNRKKIGRLIEEDTKKQGKQFEIQPADTQQKESLQALLNYCFEHAERPNPIQDLLDKGLISETFTGASCKSVKQAYDDVDTRIKEQLANQIAEQNKYDQYYVCAHDPLTTYEECSRLLE